MLKKNLRRRFVGYFFITMLVATLISTACTYLLLSRSMERTMRTDQQELAQSIIGMYTEDDSELFSGMSGPYEVYSVQLLSADAPELAKIKGRLDSGEIVMKNHWLLPIVNTYFAVGGEYYEISIFPNTTFLWQVVLSLVTAVAAALLLGIFISSFLGKRFLRPIRSLSAATEQVARGNFDIQVPTPRDAEMGKLVNNFNKMTRDLASIELLQREFTSNVSHEMKTPLASIKGFAMLLQSEDITDEQRREYASIIAQESDRMSKLCAGILRLTKLEGLEELPEPTEFSLDEQLRRTIVMLEPQWSKRDIEMEIELDEVRIYTNAELLAEVWVNLLENAIRYSHEGGKIWVRLADGLDNIVVEIEDEGCGMDETTRRRCFDRFYQGDRSHSGEGNGLGLSLTGRIVQLMGGTIDVQSAEGAGSLFRVVLPRDV